MTSRGAPAAAPRRPGLPGRSAAPVRGGAGRAGGLTGASELLRLALRRDRMLLPAWIYVLTIIAVSGGYGVKLVYKTPASRMSLAATVHHDAALLFIYGQLHGDSYGAVLSWRYLAYAALAAGLMSIFLVVRHTRADEEAGRLELVGSTVVGRHAALTAALLLALLANVLGVVLATGVLAASGLPFAGALAYGLAQAGCGLAFAALAAIGVQVSGTARGARGLLIAALGVVFLFRGVGDSGGSHGLTWLTWLSPIGWAELMQPFTGNRWWVLALPAAATAAGIAVAFALVSRRDAGAGLVPPRPGPPVASRQLAGPLGLAWRLQRGALAGWATGFFVAGLAIGVVGKGIGQLVGSTGAVSKALSKIAGQALLTNAYLAACLSLLGLVAAAYATATVLRLRAEETDGLGEPLLASPVSRFRWAGSHLLVATVGTLVVMVAGGFGMGLAFGVASSDLSDQLPRVVASSLVQVPAALAVAGVAWALVGLLPRWSVAAGWSVVAIVGLIGLFGPAVNLPQGVLDISPLTHAPKLPGGVFSATPVLWLIAATLALAAIGLSGLRRRDIG